MIADIASASRIGSLRTPSTRADASRHREYKRPYYKFGVETVQFQYYFAEIMRQRAAAVGEYLPIEEINSTQNKDARIQYPCSRS